MANFTPQEIEEILQAFFNVTGKRQYIGARYVPIFGRKNDDSVEWNNSAPYEPLSIVIYNGDSYTSRKYVPAGIDISDTGYWVITGRFNAQVEQYRQDVLSFDTRIETNTDDIESIENVLPFSDFDSTNTVKKYIDDEIESIENVLPFSDFDSTNTVKKYIDDENTEQTTSLKNDLIPFPDYTEYPKYGSLGQVLTSLANGETKWENPVVPSDAQAEEVITAWLDEHPEATTTVEDNAITTAKIRDGAITDAKLAADGIKKTVSDLDYMFRPFNAYSVPYNQQFLNNIFTKTGERVVHVLYNQSVMKIQNLYNYTTDIPFESGDVVCLRCDTPSTNECYGQLYVKLLNGNLSWVADIKGTHYYTIPNNIEQFLYRLYIPPASSAYSLDIDVSIDIIANPATMFDTHAGKNLSETNLNNVIENGIYLLSDAYDYTNKPAAYTTNTGFLEVYHTGRAVLQILRSFSYADTYVRHGWYDTLVWSSWVRIDAGDIDKPNIFYMKDFVANETDLNTVTTAGYYGLRASGNYEHKPSEFPNTSAGYLIVYRSEQWVVQLIIMHSGATMYKRRGNTNNNVWEEWCTIAYQTIYNNNYEFNEYSQTLNVTATPTITSDTNNYLASTGDSTDRTNDILTVLQTTGICRLGPGVFYVSNLQMPVATSIIGSGFATIVTLSGTTDGFAIKLNTNCLVSDMQILGADSSPASSFTETVGNRHGILWQGTYQSDSTAPTRAIINNVWIRYFTGGGITLYDTGVPSINCIEVCNAFIYECCAGVNIAYSSEFSKFTNVRSNGCYYGCVNNGGNNMFVNCDFSSNREFAFVIDNEENQSPNNSHGSCVGCVFNHTAHAGVANTGTGIKIINAPNGFIFDGCQIFYSKIYIKDSNGVVVSNSNFGLSNCDISVDGGGAVLFSGNMHQGSSPVSIVNTSNVVFSNCFLRATGQPFSA